MDIVPFDPHAASPTKWTAFHAFRRARAVEDDPGEPVLSDADVEHNMRRRWPSWENRRVLALADGQVVGSAGMSFRREGTEDYAAHAPFVFVWGGVRQGWRRRGVATVLLRAVLAFMEDHGKSTATFEAALPEGQAFLAAIGAVPKLRSVENRLGFAGLDWDGLDWDELARWEAGAPAGLRWEVHVGRVPLDRLGALMPAFTALGADEPLGKLDGPRGRYDLQGYVTWYEEIEHRGGGHFLVLLLDGDEVAGLCDGGWDARFPDRVFQALTAVARPLRGHGVAKALKARMLRLVRDVRPEARLMTTSNAAANAPMLSINGRLGFVRFKEVVTYQTGRDGLAAWLAAPSPCGKGLG